MCEFRGVSYLRNWRHVGSEALVSCELREFLPNSCNCQVFRTHQDVAGPEEFTVFLGPRLVPCNPRSVNQGLTYDPRQGTVQPLGHLLEGSLAAVKLRQRRLEREIEPEIALVRRLKRAHRASPKTK